MVYVKLQTDVMWDYLIGLKERIRPTPPENQEAYIYYMESICSSYVALCKSRIRLLIFRGRCPGGLLTCGPTCQCFTKPIRVPHEVEQWQKQHVVKLKKMREKWIQKRVK